MGVAAAATGLGQWLERTFPGTFLSHDSSAADNEGGDGGCQCEEKKCYICLHDEHGKHKGHGDGDAHHSDGGHAEDGHGDEASHDDGHAAADGHGDAAAADPQAAHKSFDNQMLNFALTGLHGDAHNDDHAEHGDHEYHPIVFVNYVDKCCREKPPPTITPLPSRPRLHSLHQQPEIPSKILQRGWMLIHKFQQQTPRCARSLDADTQISTAHPKMRTISAGEADSSYDKPCYWDEDELDKEQVRGRLPFLALATHSQIPASAYSIWLDLA
jgi:hypothetical protein